MTSIFHWTPHSVYLRLISKRLENLQRISNGSIGVPWNAKRGCENEREGRMNKPGEGKEKRKERGLKKDKTRWKKKKRGIDERQASSHLPTQFYGSQIADRLSFPIRQLALLPFPLLRRPRADQFFFLGFPSCHFFAPALTSVCKRLASSPLSR